MKSFFARLYTIIALLTLVGLLGYTAWDLYERQERALSAAKTELRLIAGHLTDLYILSKGFPDQPVKSYLTRLTKSTAWKGLSLSSDKTGLEFYRGPAPVTALPGQPIPGVPVIAPEFTKQEFFQKTLEMEVYVPSVRTYTIKGLYQVFYSDMIFDVLKRLCLALLAMLGLSAVVAILTRSRPSTMQDNEESLELDLGETEEETDLNHQLNQEETAEGIIGAPYLDNDPLDNLPGLRTGGDDEYWFDDQQEAASELNLYDLPPLDTSLDNGLSNEQANAANSEVKDSLPPLTDSPSAFNPRSGLSWAGFLEKRLNYELERCASFNQDLTLILISCPELVAKPEEAYGLLGQVVSAYFQFKDLDFEYNEEGFAIISPNQTLESTIKDLGEFLRKLERRLPQYHIYSGLSSRNGRLIESTTLLMEAQSALEKAKSGHENIVGFKSDPDRYRQFLAAGA